MIVLVAGPMKPPRFAQGLALPYLAAVLEEAGLPVKIADLYPPSPDTDDPLILDQRLADAIAQEQPNIVGMTLHTPVYLERVRLAKLLRERLPHALLIAGGHHPTAEPMDLLQNSDFDLCVIGEGEETLREIARRVADGAGRPDTWLETVRGVVFKKEGRIIRTPPRPVLSNVDSLPFPAHHLLGLQEYAPHPLLGVPSQGVLTYRGCPMRCAFCLNPQGRRVRRRDPSRVAEEMARVVSEFNVRGFNLYDNLFGLNRSHALAVCDELIRRKLDIIWDAWTGGDWVDEKLAARMKAAGCVRVGFGAESGDDAILRRARPGFTSAQNAAGIRALKAAGLRVETFFMIGLPGESEESVRRTVDFAIRCGADEVCLSLHRPYPGTAVWRNPEALSVRVVQGPRFEAYLETEHLSRSGLLEWSQRAREELQAHGLMRGGFLRYDRYAWESV